MSKKIVYAFLISFVLLIAVIILNRFASDSMKRYTRWVDHTREVITTLESLSNNFKSAQVYTPTYDSGRLKAFYGFYKKDADNIGSQLTYIKSLVTDNPEQLKLVDSLAIIINEQFYAVMQKNTTEMIRSGEEWRLNILLTIHEMIRRGITNEKKLLAERQSELDSSTKSNNLLTTAFAVIAAGIFIFTFLFIFFLSKQRNWLEGFLESILNTSQNGIVHYKTIRKEGKIIDFKIEFVNKAIVHLLEIKMNEVIGKRLSEIPSYVKETNLFEKYIKVVETGQPAEFETLYQRGNIERWFLISLVKLGDGITASFQNITELKRYEEELKQNIKELQHSNAELEQYAYVASHDLQEPLRKIRSFGSFLQDTQAKKLDEKGQEQLNKIMSAAERMSVLIKDILSFSSMKKDDLFVSTELDVILAAVLQDLDLAISQKQAQIQSDALPVIEAIPLQMQQLFYNLINNSLKFAKEEEKPVIQISCRQLNENEKSAELLKNIPYYEIIFSDNGIGFSPEYASQIFGLFKRLNDKQFYPGSGIGLALCKKVVENHHGEIRAVGKEDEGASFYIYLPLQQQVVK